MTLFDILHFERPYWLLFIPVTLLIYFYLGVGSQIKNSLNKIVDQSLLNYLEHKDSTNSINKWLGLYAICLFWIGVAGISWSKAPTTMFANTNKTVLVVDQSLSMYATDIKPNRLTQLKQIVRDILEQTKEGETALVAFAGDAFTISPFSQDKETITHFLVALEPDIMPLYGSNLREGIRTAISLEEDDSSPLHLIILTDDLNQQDKDQIPSLLNNRNITLDLIAIGTKDGAFMRRSDGQIVRINGKNIIPKTPINELETLTKSVDGRFYHGRLSVQELATITNTTLDSNQTKKAENKGINWTEQGHWFAIPFLFWLAIQFRKGVLIALLVGLLYLPSETLEASPLDWFLKPDQKGQEAVNQGDWQKAGQHFQQPSWKAASSYALKNYQDTIKSLESLKTRNAFENYNLGNAFALSGENDKAISAYEKALEQNPSLKEAKDNLEYLKKKQTQEQEDKKNEQKQKNKDPSQKSDQDKQQEDSKEDNKNDSKDHSDTKKENKKDEKEDKKKPSEDNKKDTDSDKRQKEPSPDKPIDKEQEQALKQWLRQIQNEPGSLLQRKLWYQHQEKLHENSFRQEDGQNPW